MSRRYTSLEKKYILFLCKLVCGTIIRITSLKRNFHDNLGTGGWLAVLNMSVFFHKYFAAGTFHAITNHFYFSFHFSSRTFLWIFSLSVSSVHGAIFSSVIDSLSISSNLTCKTLGTILLIYQSFL